MDGNDYKFQANILECEFYIFCTIRTRNTSASLNNS